MKTPTRNVWPTIVDEEQATRIRSQLYHAIVTAIFDTFAAMNKLDEQHAVIQPELIEDALIYALAGMIEANPGMKTTGSLRKEAEYIAKAVYGQMKDNRAEFERTGQHFWPMTIEVSQ